MSESPNECPFCKEKLILPYGPASARLVLVGEFPGDNEIKQNRPFVAIYRNWGIKGPASAGAILEIELQRVGISIKDCLITNVWMHKADICDGFDWHLAHTIKAIKKCKVILLMGSTATEAFLRKNVSEVSGLRMYSDLLPGIPIYPAPNPAQLFWGTVGEFRLSAYHLSCAPELRGTINNFSTPS